MRPLAELARFVRDEMRMAEIYQPVIIRALLERGGTATVTELAEELAQWRDRPAEELRSRILQYPREVLAQHQVARFDPETDEFTLLFELDDEDLRDEISALCVEKAQAWLGTKEGDQDSSPWDDFVYWAGWFFRADTFEADERTYKLEIADHVQSAHDAITADDPNWHGTLKKAFGQPNNLTYFINHAKFLDWAQEHPAEAREALLGLWDTGTDLAARIDQFVGATEAVLTTVAPQLEIVSFLLLNDPTAYAFFRSTPFKKAIVLTGHDPLPGTPSSAIYLAALRFLDTVVQESNDRGLELRDRLDAQGILWALTRAKGEELAMPPEEVAAFLRWRGDLEGTWWVNQGATYDHERSGGYVWAPQRTERGAVLAHWLNVSKLRQGDVVVHYARGRIRAIGRVSGKPQAASKPAALESQPWESDGWKCSVRYFELDQPIGLADIPEDLRRGEKPVFNNAGGVNQAYMHPLSAGFAGALRDLFAERWPPDSPWGSSTATKQHWMFQANPAVYDFLADLNQLEIGGHDDWTVTRYMAEYSVGDDVAIWVAGPDAALWALGGITGEVYDRPPDVRFGGGDPDTPEKAIPWTLTRIVNPPLHKRDLVTHPILKDLQVIQAPQGTNFKITPEQWEEILAMVDDRPALTLEAIHQRMTDAGFQVSMQTLRRYHYSLGTRGFVILSGLSGTGKTWLAELYAEAIGARFKLIPVAPNWTTNEDLLGYFNPLDGKYYDTEFSRFLRDAAAEYERAQDEGTDPQPFHVLLDEMNLARVEYYFAKFLSAMELVARQGAAAITAGPDDEIIIYPNLRFIGTVNVDETTHGFADKVYDRAQLVELGITREDLETHLTESDIAEPLLELWDAVEGFKPFAYRIADEINTYVTAATGSGVATEDALDDQILQKVLPRLNGADGRLALALEAIIDLAGDRYPQTEAKARRMLDDLKTHGFASYF